MTGDPSRRLGPIWLAPGIGRGNALSFLYAAFFSVCLLSFLSFMQPFVLDAHLGIPRSRQGHATFLLGTTQEIVMLLLVGPFGALADKLGRRVLYALGLAWIGAGYVLYPLADSLSQLVATRFFFAIGAAMIGTVMATVLAEFDLLPKTMGEPAWQELRDRQLNYIPAYVSAALFMFVVGWGTLFLLRHQYQTGVGPSPWLLPVSPVRRPGADASGAAARRTCHLGHVRRTPPRSARVPARLTRVAWSTT